MELSTGWSDPECMLRELKDKSSVLANTHNQQSNGMTCDMTITYALYIF